jgi:hypothetical protein
MHAHGQLILEAPAILTWATQKTKVWLLAGLHESLALIVP